MNNSSSAAERNPLPESSPMPSLEFASPASALQPPASSRPIAKIAKRLLLVGAIVVLVIIAVIAWLGYLYYQAAYTPAEPSGPQVKITIAAGATSDHITDQLKQANLINNPDYFKIYLRLHSAIAIQAGDFSIPQHISFQDLVDQLSRAERHQAILTFPEGLRREELADIVDKQYQDGNISFTGQQFSDLALNPNVTLRQKLGNRLPANASLQGYLFPDTYHIESDATAEDLIIKMLNNYLKKITPDIQAGFAKQGLTEYQALTLAAIVERESFAGEERPIIGQIMLKRLRTNEILGVDATLQYALGYSATEKRWWRQNITAQDLELQSPYNTRRQVGLPPAPIANPGLEAIQAIAKPQDTPYLYYLHDSQGRVYYAKTLSEHNANVARYLQ